MIAVELRAQARNSSTFEDGSPLVVSIDVATSHITLDKIDTYSLNGFTNYVKLFYCKHQLVYVGPTCTIIGPTIFFI